MERIATWPEADREELIQEASALRAMPVEVMEKDFWGCWVLNRLLTRKNRHTILVKRCLIGKGAVGTGV